jgi:hypothetical protein
MPFNVEMHYLLAMHLHGGPWAGMYLAQLMHVGMCAAAAWAVFALAGGGRRGTVAGLLVAAAPWTGLLAPVAYNEGGTLLFGTLAIGWAIRAKSWREFVIAGLMAGFAAGTKLSVVPLILLAVPITVFALRPRYFAGCACYVLAALLVLSPWLIRDWKWTGNPVFPAMSVLGKGHFTGVQVERWREAYWPNQNHRSIAGRAEEAWSQVIADWRYGFVLLPLGAAAFVLSIRKKETLYLGILFAFQLAFWLCFTHLQSRFMVMEIPIIALLIAQCEMKIWIRMTAAASVAMAIFSCAMLIDKLGPYIELDRRTSALIGRENLEGFRMFDVRRLQDDQSLDLVGDAAAFWYQIPMSRLHYKTVFDVDTSDPNESIEQAWLAGMPVNALIWRDEPELQRFAKTYYGIPKPGNADSN